LGTPAARRYRISAKAHQNNTFSNEKSHISGVAERRKLSWSNVPVLKNPYFKRVASKNAYAVATFWQQYLTSESS
jgi:hypothetical protein